MQVLLENPSTEWIQVIVGEGMFSSEKSVVIELSNGDKVSLFADKNLLKEKNGNWFLKVAPIKKNRDSQIVLLPIEPFENSSRWVEVPLP
jgi:hypothetical protein